MNGYGSNGVILIFLNGLVVGRIASVGGTQHHWCGCVNEYSASIWGIAQLVSSWSGRVSCPDEVDVSCMKIYYSVDHCLVMFTAGLREPSHTIPMATTNSGALPSPSNLAPVQQHPHAPCHATLLFVSAIRSMLPPSSPRIQPSLSCVRNFSGTHPTKEKREKTTKYHFNLTR